MIYEAIRFSIENDVATITLNRPDVMNALNAQMRAEIIHAVKASESDARVLVLTGEGRAFCSGQDLGDGATAANMDLERVLRDEYVPMLNAIYDSRIPTISAVNGAAAGAGANLALAADVVIASEEAFFQQAFTRIGLIPDAGGTYFLPRQVGMARAMGASLFADRIPAKQALDWGMIYETAPAKEFVDHWKARALHLATGPTVAYRQLKKAMRVTYDNSLEAQLTLEARLQGRCGKTRDFQEGVLSFLEKRDPSYEGR